MSNFLRKAKWNPYFAGALVGVLAVVTAVVTNMILGKTNYLGASTTFVRATGFIEKIFSEQHVSLNEYFQAEKVKVDWQMMLLVGIFLGALVSSILGKSFKTEKVPPMWNERFGESQLKRGVAAFIGGTIAIFGARLAGGCPSGHGLSGNMQLAVSGLLAMVFFLVGGIITARFIYERRK